MENVAPALINPTLIALISALVAFTAALLVGFGAHFVTEDYRRFRDSTAIAAALAGEMGSIILSLPGLRTVLIQVKDLLDERKPIALPEMPDQSSPIFEANAEKIGLLGADFAGRVAFTYDQIRGFRTSFQLLSKHHTTMDPSWSGLVAARCLQLVESNQPKAEILVDNLKLYSETWYVRAKWVQMSALAGITLIGLVSLITALYRALPS
ncbi:hypothetical protein IFT48_17295 [Pseudomonas fluorescens]|uniref:hypothetical protein n=1 Tax=Pseudomonas fluorescens TaxID=294 RepID=UPI00190485E6|nr:hypothetical protein [Pseudomonas fluorescens]MBD8091750.1 hypothetical protein [Pseudomonas fluorescens]MBD8716127.1 hypothetical protein [Pseudomonas fluorescens]